MSGEPVVYLADWHLSDMQRDSVRRMYRQARRLGGRMFARHTVGRLLVCCQDLGSWS